MEVSANAKKGKQKIYNFEYGFRPIYYFSRLVGLLPFSIAHHSNGSITNAHISRLDGVWFSISMCFHLLAIFLSFLNTEDLNSISSVTTITFWILYILYRGNSLLIGTVGIIMDMLNRHKLADILRKFIIFDHDVSVNRLISILIPL